MPGTKAMPLGSTQPAVMSTAPVTGKAARRRGADEYCDLGCY
jgi:hypothetical protein